MAYKVNPTPQGGGTFTQMGVVNPEEEKKKAQTITNAEKAEIGLKLNGAAQPFQNTASRFENPLATKKYAAEQWKPQVPYVNPTLETAPVAGAYSGYAAMLDGYRNEALANQERLKAQRDAAVDSAYDEAVDGLGEAKGGAMRDAYIAYMNGLKNMPQIAAAVGNGGYAQSLATKQQLNYENSRSDIAQEYLNNLRKLNAERAAGKLSNSENYINSMATIADSMADRTVKLAQSEPQTAWTGNYKLGDRTVSEDEMIKYLVASGMSSSAALEYMKKIHNGG